MNRLVVRLAWGALTGVLAVLVSAVAQYFREPAVDWNAALTTGLGLGIVFVIFSTIRPPLPKG